MHFVKKKGKGKTYLSIGETYWVDGKAKITILKYLGSAEMVYQIAEEKKPIETINRHTKERAQGFSVGKYIHIITLNRAFYPRSKSCIRG